MEGIHNGKALAHWSVIVSFSAHLINTSKETKSIGSDKAGFVLKGILSRFSAIQLQKSDIKFYAAA